jgi:Fur family transcriptional regulator, ferric uptake regulator
MGLITCSSRFCFTYLHRAQQKALAFSSGTYYNSNMRMRHNLKLPDKLGDHFKTRQRQLLLDIIGQAKGHIDAKELFKRAFEKDNSISHATVYRSLNLFKELGLISGNRLGKAQCYYEINQSPEHQHLVCRHCGKVIDFACPLGQMIQKVKTEHGFTVTKAEIYLEGFCSNCDKQNKSK